MDTKDHYQIGAYITGVISFICIWIYSLFTTAI